MGEGGQPGNTFQRLPQGAARGLGPSLSPQVPQSWGVTVMGQVRCCHHSPHPPGESGDRDAGDKGGQPLFLTLPATPRCGGRGATSSASEGGSERAGHLPKVMQHSRDQNPKYWTAQGQGSHCRAASPPVSGVGITWGSRREHRSFPLTRDLMRSLPPMTPPPDSSPSPPRATWFTGLYATAWLHRSSALLSVSLLTRDLAILPPEKG